jgi:hypothetical protein
MRLLRTFQVLAMTASSVVARRAESAEAISMNGMGEELSGIATLRSQLH